MAARVDPVHASAQHQSLHHFVAKAEWSDEQMLRRVCQWVVPKMDFNEGGWWIIDDTGFPKKGRHTVGVARQCCGVLGKQDNCQVAVSVSLSCSQGSLPVAWQLYLPKEWTEDDERRRKAGVPEAMHFATKTEIALEQLRRLLAEGAPKHVSLAALGSVGKVGGVKAGNALVGKAGAAAATAAETAQGWAKVALGGVVDFAEVYKHPVTTAVLAPYAVQKLFEECECHED